MEVNKPLGLGLVGCGAFGLFCLRTYHGMSQLRIVAAARARKPAAQHVCRELGVPTFDEYRQVIENPGVSIVHIATPPGSHYELAMAALRAGKHVLCEKPPALRRSEAEEIVRTAQQAGLFLATNFVMRYSPVAGLVGRIIESGVLGRVLAGQVTNCASDSGLHPDHWFWDKSISGGIFIEHGVHFFDLYESWLGPGCVIDACCEFRPGTMHQDRAACTVLHESGAIVSHYHGFDQIGPMDRTDHRLMCEMGDIRTNGWVPMGLTVDAAVDEPSAERLGACCPDARVETIERYGGGREILGRGVPRKVTRRIRMQYAPFPDKEALYAQCLRRLLTDQISWVRRPAHLRIVTEDDGPTALAYAEAAAQLAADRQTGRAFRQGRRTLANH